jgi:hypothetical protein
MINYDWWTLALCNSCLRQSIPFWDIHSEFWDMRLLPRKCNPFIPHPSSLIRLFSVADKQQWTSQKRTWMSQKYRQNR